MKEFTVTPEQFATGEHARLAIRYLRDPNWAKRPPRKKPAPFKQLDRQVGTITPEQFAKGDAAWINKRRLGHRTFPDPAIKPMAESVVDVLLEAEPDEVPDEHYMDWLAGERRPKHHDKDVIRKVKAMGYTLVLWDTNQRDRFGQYNVGYELISPEGRTLFYGEDYGPGNAVAVDSDESVRGILNFLTLKPGDTDDEYFEKYTPEQMAFAEGDAEQLNMYALSEDPMDWDEDFEVGNWLPGEQE